MTTNSEALDELHKAASVLMRAYGDAQPPQDKKIMTALHVLNREYYALLGLDPHMADANYSALTDEFKKSKALINGIVKARNQITADIQLAAQILQALGPLVALV